MLFCIHFKFSTKEIYDSIIVCEYSVWSFFSLCSALLLFGAVRIFLLKFRHSNQMRSSRKYSNINHISTTQSSVFRWWCSRLLVFWAGEMPTRGCLYLAAFCLQQWPRNLVVVAIIVAFHMDAAVPIQFRAFREICFEFESRFSPKTIFINAFFPSPLIYLFSFLFIVFSALHSALCHRVCNPIFVDRFLCHNVYILRLFSFSMFAC